MSYIWAHKARISILLTASVLLAFHVWPFFKTSVLWKYDDEKQVAFESAQMLNIIDIDPQAPNDWETLDLGFFSTQLPEFKVDNVEIVGEGENLLFKFQSFTALFSEMVVSRVVEKKLSDLGKEMPVVSFEERSAIEKASSDDISVFNSPIENYSSLNILEQKLRTKRIKARSYLFRSENVKGVIYDTGRETSNSKKNFDRIAFVYSPNEKITFSIYVSSESESESMNYLMIILKNIKFVRENRVREDYEKALQKLRGRL